MEFIVDPFEQSSNGQAQLERKQWTGLKPSPCGEPLKLRANDAPMKLDIRDSKYHEMWPQDSLASLSVLARNTAQQSPQQLLREHSYYDPILMRTIALTSKPTRQNTYLMLTRVGAARLVLNADRFL